MKSLQGALLHLFMYQTIKVLKLHRQMVQFEIAQRGVAEVFEQKQDCIDLLTTLGKL